MRYFLLFLLPLYLVAKPFKVATYNVENLFDATYQGSEYEEYIPGKHNWNQRMMEIKLNHIAEVICDLDADILGLQEIENESVFERLKKRLKRVGCAYHYSAITHKRGAPIQVAMFSRFPVAKQKELQVSISPLVRNILEVEVYADGNPLTVFVNHWKSKGRKGVESKRIRYAKTLQKRIDSLPRNKEYIILGDLNSNYNVHLTLDKKIDDSHGITALGDVLHTTVDNKLVQENQMPKAKRGIHYNTWQELPFNQRWSHKFYGNRSTLDHILLPSNMFDGRGIDYVNDSFGVYKADYLFTKRGYINSWKYKHGKHRAKGYSDHLPVFALFDTQPYKTDKSKEISNQAVIKPIEYLYTLKRLKHPVKLENAVVVLKRGNHAIVKQTPLGRGIFLFGCAKGLKEGKKYDLLVQSIHTYKGLKEVTDIVKFKEKGGASLGDFYQRPKKMRQNEIIRDIEGTYRGRYLFTNGIKIPIHFKNKHFTPSNGSKLKIHYAHLGYYKKLQLVIYSKKDFEIMER
ncbi:endonuclease/exonuclease/phosphatase family protein [Sulfurovum sp.]|uniref:endonuclease/exonuclease/phosphatase family protein n=1 Tax=Sulfurovum sp. TaxID=1969726 RepID=UPI0025F70B75|nr:endonuclease/exonuclease/phosphatase family protein [Sulfurovum sp.]